MAGEAALHKRRVTGLAVREVTEAPAAGRGVLCRVLHHELNVGGRTGNERLNLAKDFVVFVRWVVTVMLSG